MKKTILLIGPVMVAVLLMVSAGCTAPSTGTSPSTDMPAITALTPPTGGETKSPQVAKKGDTVSVYYTGTFENGTVFDSNMNATTPVEFILGNSSVIEGFEEAVTGMSENQQKTVNIPAEKAYGAYNLSLIHTVNRTGPIADTPFVEGQSYSIHDKETNAYSMVKVLNVTPATVSWDANNPLAGLNFTFTIKLVRITGT
jgi:peptidylprolyl isomerase